MEATHPAVPKAMQRGRLRSRSHLRGTARASTRELRQATALATLDIQKLVDA